MRGSAAATAADINANGMTAAAAATAAGGTAALVLRPSPAAEVQSSYLLRHVPPRSQHRRQPLAAGKFGQQPVGVVLPRYWGPARPEPRRPVDRRRRSQRAQRRRRGAGEGGGSGRTAQVRRRPICEVPGRRLQARGACHAESEKHCAVFKTNSVEATRQQQEPHPSSTWNAGP